MTVEIKNERTTITEREIQKNTRPKKMKTLREREQNLFFKSTTDIKPKRKKKKKKKQDERQVIREGKRYLYQKKTREQKKKEMR